jgi:Glycosyl hydrolases family 39
MAAVEIITIDYFVNFLSNQNMKIAIDRRWVVLFLLVALVLPISTIEVKSNSPVVFNPPTRIVSANLFGMHIHDALENWPNVPFSQWRLWDAGVAWGDLEAQPGAWKFELLDRYVDIATKQKVNILLTLGQTPRWASARPNDESPYGSGWPAEPANLKDWRNYVRTIATRYRGKIRNYEIWNEPDLKNFYSGSVEKMVELAKEAHTILKQVDPQITVISPGATDATPDFQWQRDYFRQGGGKYADAISQHFYPKSAAPEDLGKYITQMRAVMAEFGLAQKPLWNTEAGWLKPGEIAPERQAMAYVARTYLINWASGVERFYWYAWDNQTAVSLHLTKIQDKKLIPVTNVTNSYAQIQKWLVGAKMQKCGANATKTWVCNLTRKGQPFWIVWHLDRELNFTIPKNWQVRTIQDLSGKNQTLPDSRQISIDFMPVLLSATKLR